MENINFIYPEIFIAISILGLLMVGVFKTNSFNLVTKLTSFMLLITIPIVFLNSTVSMKLFSNNYIVDELSSFLKILILGSSAFALFFTDQYIKKNKLDKFEYPVLITTAILGMFVMVSSNNLIGLYLGIELQSLSLYVLASLNRDSTKSTEAGVKYFVLGALSSGLLLYGCSLVYGFTGSANYYVIAEKFSADNIALLFGLVFILIGLAFKISAVPFHMWTPDVYEGAPTPVTAFLATAPKVAAMGLFARVVHDAFGGAFNDWSQILILLSVLSMLFGSIAAIGQKDIKRLMAYSSISHMGFALMGLTSGGLEGVQSMLIYMAIYVMMNIGTFAFIISMEVDGKPVSEINSLQMYSKTNPGRSMALLILMFSLAGIPPLLGFFGKFYVLKAAITSELYLLATAGVIASVIGAFYYLRIIYYIYFGENPRALDQTHSLFNQTVLVISALAMVLGVVNLFGLEFISELAANALVN